jgi:uncharacterized protein with HEPN domain
MREPVKDKGRLEHMLAAIDIILQRTSGMTLEDLDADKVVYGGIAYYTMIIGEAAYMLSPDFKDSHPATPWRQIEGMRHHIVHGYFQVRKDLLWNVIDNDLVPLKEQIKQYLTEM